MTLRKIARRTTVAGALAAATLLAAPAAHADTKPSAVYTAIDEFQARSSNVVITGLVDGDAATSTRTWSVYSNNSGADNDLRACQAAAFMVMSKPGKYVLKVYQTSYYYTCALARQ